MTPSVVGSPPRFGASVSAAGHLLRRLNDLLAARHGEGQQYLLLLRFVLLNTTLLALAAAVYAQGWLDAMIATDKFNLIKLNIAVFLFGLGLCARRITALSEELNELQSGDFTATSRVGRYLRQVRGMDSGGRALVADALKLRFGVRLAGIRHIASAIVLIGLIGTVIGFIIALSGVDAEAATDAEAIAPMITTLLLGMSIALYKTLVGSVLNIWLTLNCRLLEAGAVHLVAGMIDLGEDDARS